MSWWHHPRTPVGPPPPPPMRAVAVVVPVAGAVVYVDDVTPPGGHSGATNADGYVEFTVSDAPLLNASMVRVTADGYKPYQANGVDFPVGNFQIRIGVAADPNRPQDVLLPALEPDAPPIPPKPPFAPWRGAFCIPDALPGIPFGDHQRIWTPAFGCYAGSSWQDRILDETLARGYNALEYQISGRPYGNDYPELALDVDRIVADLAKIRSRGLRTIIAFRDDVGDDLSYLAPVAAATQELVDDVMGIYEVNGVLQDPDKVLHVLVQSREFWPGAILAVHFTDLVEGESHGLVDWHQAVEQAGLNALFFQASGWMYGPERVAIRLADFTRRLSGPQFHGYPTLSHGVALFELTTSKTYRGMPEAEGKAFTDAVLAVPMATDEGVWSVPASGFMDGGS